MDGSPTAPCGDDGGRSTEAGPGTMKLQTLGDAIDARMEARADSPAAAALALGVTVDELLAWMGDEDLPDAGQVDTVLGYLEIDAERYRGLCLRSQMRRVQSNIRNGPSARSA